MMLLGVLSSCTDDDSFTTAPSHVLTLSVDTVNIDSKQLDSLNLLHLIHDITECRLCELRL